jgi:DMSO/TMAO reductase YedYZ molybdopterin-dependent catalytic subunit
LVAWYAAADLLGQPPPPDVVQPVFLAILPGAAFGFLIDNLQHLGKVVEEAVLLLAVVATGALTGAGGARLWRLLIRHAMPSAPADPGRRSLLSLLPVGVACVGIAYLGWRLLPRWASALAPPESEGGIVPAITPVSSFYQVTKNFRDPIIDSAAWALQIDGLVKENVRLSYAELLAMPAAVELVTLECVSNRVGGRLISTGRFEGPRLTELLGRAQPSFGARHLAFHAADGYLESLPIREVGREILVAHTLNGQRLPDGHGFPARLVIPGRYGMNGPKWLDRISVGASAVDGYWEGRGWNPAGTVRTMSRIDAPSDRARITRGAIEVAGVAFAGNRGVSSVEVSPDGSKTWATASLDPPLSAFTWVQWRWPWSPRSAGVYTLTVRARDGSGRLQEKGPENSFPSGAAGLHMIQVSVA